MLGNFRLFSLNQNIELLEKGKLVSFDPGQFYRNESVFLSESTEVPSMYHNIVIISTKKVIGIFKGINNNLHGWQNPPQISIMET